MDITHDAVVDHGVISGGTRFRTQHRTRTEEVTVQIKSRPSIQNSRKPNYRHYDGVQVLLFNKSIAEQYDIENLYQCVTDGRWTVDKMGEVCRLTTKELDGNGKMDRYDQWGYASFDIGRDAHYENLCAFWGFPEGRSLLYWSAVHYIPWKLRDIEFDFGILPIPKYDEAQTEEAIAESDIAPAESSDAEETTENHTEEA